MRADNRILRGHSRAIAAPAVLPLAHACYPYLSVCPCPAACAGEVLPPDVMNAALSVHHGEVRRALERHGGHEAGTEVRGRRAEGGEADGEGRGVF